MYVPKSALTVSGNAKYSRVTAESGRWVDRGICSNCGSNLFILAALVPDLQGIWAGSLHDVNNFEPQVHVWTRSAPSWSSLSADLKKIAVAPNEAEFKALLADVAEAV